MEWYVLNYDWNKKEVYNYNIFTNVKFNSGITEILASNPEDFNEFVEKLDRELKYCFWSKREYEISVGDAFEEDANKLTKIDVYSQVAPNVKQLAIYIMECIASTQEIA
jgi:hypothetical protein